MPTNGQVYETKDRQPAGPSYQVGFVRCVDKGNTLFLPFLNTGTSKLTDGDTVNFQQRPFFLTSDKSGYEINVAVLDNQGNLNGKNCNQMLGPDLGIILHRQTMHFVCLDTSNALKSSTGPITFFDRIYYLKDSDTYGDGIPIQIVLNPGKS